MDSITQAVFGAAVAGAIAPPGHRRKALVIGAALGTLPDLDVMIDYGDPVSNMTYHRGFSHSLFVLPVAATLIWLVLRLSWSVVRERPQRWYWLVFLSLVTHPLLDAHTAYGTQLFWPIASPPVMWSTLFIIDPLYTLPILVGVIWVSRNTTHARFSRALIAALTISTTYMGWSWVAKGIAESNAREALAGLGLSDAPIFSTPAPFNTVLWRIVALTDSGYVEGYFSLIADDTVRFRSFDSDLVALNDASHLPAASRLRWFTRDFMRTSVDDGRLVLADLRMGTTGQYAFAHAVAERSGATWKAIHPVRVASPSDSFRLTGMWDRIWQSSDWYAPLQTEWPELGLAAGPDGWYLSRRDGEWGTQSSSQILRFDIETGETSGAEFGMPDRDESDFYYSASRRQACFVSNRESGQLPRSDDIWCMEWRDTHWDEAVPMPPPLNSEAIEFSPVLRPNGDIWFASDRDGGLGYGDIYRAYPTNDGWAVERLGPAINSAGGEWNLEISPDGEMLLFESSHRETNRTVSGDIYVSYRTNEGWSDARPVPFLNTDGSDLMPRFVDDDTIIYATSVGRDVELKSTSRREIERAVPPLN